jgi:adenylate kinase
MLSEWLEGQGRAVGAVISLEVNQDLLIARLSGRRTCLSCGATYHVSNNPPAVEGSCDRCDGDVVQRKDDTEETVRARLETYDRDTAPVLAWLNPRADVHAIDGAQAIDVVRSSILDAIQN